MDKYAKAIEFLTERPNEIYAAWSSPRNHFAGCLFQYASPRGGLSDCPVMLKSSGCLTQIRSFNGDRVVHGRTDLTEQILADTRIPKHESKITLDTLPVFAEWQRILDKELGRV